MHCAKNLKFQFLIFQWKQGVDMFGKRVGFLKFKADVLDKKTGTKVPD